MSDKEHKLTITGADLVDSNVDSYKITITFEDGRKIELTEREGQYVYEILDKIYGKRGFDSSFPSEDIVYPHANNRATTNTVGAFNKDL